MKKQLTIMFGLCAALSLSAQSNPIDAVTSASGKLQILGGQAFTDYAEVQWKDDYNNGSTHLLKYGTSQSYGSEINLFPFARRTTITTTISDLTPGTLYYGQFYRVYEGSARTTNFQFTTYAVTTVVPRSSSRNDLTITGEQSIRVIGINGRALHSEQLQRFLQSYTGQSTLKSSSLSPGIYNVLITDLQSSRQTSAAVTITR
jgi:hypothetical protein